VALILVVDDEDPVRELLALVLEEAGHRVLRAQHGAQALAHAAVTWPDLVLSDVMMPMMSGLELWQRMQSIKRVPFILMSAAGEHAVQHVRADAFVSKPFDIDTIDQVVKCCLLPVSQQLSN
jgi:two-component system response regulator ResD